MISLLLIICPLVLAVINVLLPSPGMRGWMVLIAGSLHLVLVAIALFTPSVGAFGGWLELDRLGRVVLLQTSIVYFVASLYTPAYLALRKERNNRTFTTALITFLAMISL